MNIPKPSGYQKRILEQFCLAFHSATGEDYGISWGMDNKGFLAMWERAYGSVMGIKRFGEEPTEEEIERIFKLIERKLEIAVELHLKDSRWNPFPCDPIIFSKKMNSYLESRSSKPATSKPTQSAEELKKELEQ